jgi:hypothetical protein
MTAPDDITPAELVAIEARCEAATQMAHVRQPNWEAYALGMLSQCAMDERVLLAAVRKQSDRVKHYQWEASQLQAERDAAKALLARAVALLARAVALLVSYRDGTRSTYRIDADVTGLLAEIEGADHGKP